MIQQRTSEREILKQPVKPLLRGWSHAIAALASIVLTVLLCWLSREDIPRLLSMLIFGLSMIELYTVSAIYHIIKWSAAKRRVLRSIDHANIFVLIAGTYTPLCFNILTGWVRITLLAVIWLLALSGIGISIFALNIPRRVTAALYISMGWVVVLALPALLAVLPWIAVATLILGGVLYTIGALPHERILPGQQRMPHGKSYPAKLFSANRSPKISGSLRGRAPQQGSRGLAPWSQRSAPAALARRDGERFGERKGTHRNACCPSSLRA